MAGWTEATLSAYVAGFIDTDGSIGIHRNGTKARTYRIRVSLYNNNRPALEFIQLQFGGTIHSRKPCEGRFAKKIQHCLVWQAKRASAVLKKAMPFLIVKAEQARLALEMYEKNQQNKFDGHSDRSWQEEFYRKAKLLNA
jgi:hypothetical protein